MQDLFQLTDLEKKFMEKALMVVKNQMAIDLIEDKIQLHNEYLDILKSWMWKELNLNDEKVKFILSNPNRYMKFSGVNPNSIIKYSLESLDQIQQKTKDELTEGTCPWVFTYKAVREYLERYPLETEFKFSLPDKVFFRMKSDSSYSEWLSVNVRKKSFSMSFLDGKVSDFLVNTLQKTMQDKTAELAISSLEQRLNLKDKEGEYKFVYVPETNGIRLRINMEPSVQYETYVSMYDMDELYQRLSTEISNFETKYKAAKTTCNFLEEYLTSLGFNVNYSLNHSLKHYDYHIHLEAHRDDDYIIDTHVDIYSLSTEKGQKEFKSTIEKGLKNNAKIKEYLTNRLSEENVEWKYVAGDYYSKIKIGSFTEKIEIFNFYSDIVLHSVVDSLLLYAKVESLAKPIIRKHIDPLGVKWELKTDNKYNLVLSVFLPGIPAMVKTLILKSLEKDIIVFSDQIFRKKQTLHIP